MAQTIAIAASIVALWPVWAWCASRLADRSDDPLGVVALVAAVALTFASRSNAFTNASTKDFTSASTKGFTNASTKDFTSASTKDFTNASTKDFTNASTKDFTNASINRCAGACADPDKYGASAIFLCFALYAITGSVLPMLVRATFAITALILLISPYFYGKRLHLPTYGLLLLSLPIVATMQFYLGYPLRLLVAEAVRGLVSCAGYAVSLQGTDLIWNTQIIGIDPACSGVRMLWTAFFVCFVYAGINKLSNARTVMLAAATLGIALAGNVFRAATLFMLAVYKARTGFDEPGWMHAGIGILLFGFALVGIGFVANRLVKAELGRRERLHNGDMVNRFVSSSGLVIAGILLAFIAPYMVPGQAQAARVSTTLDFPKTFQGRELKPIPLTPQEQAFAASFPGRIGKFTDGRNQLILRWVTTPTRQLHPSEDCFRGLGYQIHALPNVHDNATSSAWGAFQATTKNGTKLMVREQITDESNSSYTDVSAWYWSAALGKSHGPWLATTVATELN